MNENDLLKDQRGSPAYISPDVLSGKPYAGKPSGKHSLIRGVIIQSCSAGAKNLTNYVFCHVQFNSPGQSSKNHCAIKAKF